MERSGTAFLERRNARLTTRYLGGDPMVGPCPTCRKGGRREKQKLYATQSGTRINWRCFPCVRRLVGRRSPEQSFTTGVTHDD